jgi:eukaryotic-like serine/threonine-protein kinase
MITRDGHSKILDFGLAKLLDPQDRVAASRDGSSEVATAILPQHSTPGMVLGTVGYMSPEQARGQTDQIDHRSDIFSFGCILFEVVTGHRAFEGADVIDTLNKIIREPVASISNFNQSAPADLQRIVRRCLAKDPEERYQSIKDVAIELKELRREIAISADFDTTVPPPGGGAKREGSSSSAGQGTASSAPPESLAPRASSAEYVVAGVKRHRGALFFALMVVACAGLAYAVYRFASQAEPKVAHFQKMRITRVTTEGNVESATISPDGKYIAYSLEESGRRSLWTKHLGTGSRVQIVPTGEAFEMNASNFSADGGYVYYTRVDEENPQGALYQVPVLGGTPKKILANVVQPVSLSPDGKHIAFGRYHLKGAEDELLVADADGSNERRVITVKEPNWLGGSSPAWSPDGKALAVGYGSETRNELTGQNLGMTVALVSVANGELKPIAPPRWLYVGNMAWFNDGGGLVFVAREQTLGPRQIWQISYPQGEARRITNDLNSYAFFSLTLTINGGALVAVQSDPVSNIWIAPARDAGDARPLTTGKNVLEGQRGLAWTPDGKVLYDSNINSKASIWILNAGGGEPKPLTDSSEEDSAPEVSPDGRYIIFGSLRGGGNQVWRMDIDGANQKQLTRESGGVPTFSISPDGRRVIYNPFVGGIRKVSIDGGEPIEMVAEGSLRYPQVSPDGNLLAYFFDDERAHRPKIAVVKFDDGSPVKTFDLPVTSGTSLYEKLFYHSFHWSPDGRALVYINTVAGVSNLWSQPLDGGKPAQLTNFTSDRILSFAYSHDGRQLALARGSQSSDAVLISESK